MWERLVTCNGIIFCIRYLDTLPGTSAPYSDGILSLLFVAPLAWRTPKLELLHIICSGQPCLNACIRRLFLQVSGTVGNPEESGMGLEGHPCPVYCARVNGTWIFPSGETFVRSLDCRDPRKKFRCIATQSNNLLDLFFGDARNLVSYYQVPDLGCFAKSDATARLRHCLEVCKWFQIWSDVDSRVDFDNMRGLDESFHRRVVPKVTFESTTTHPSHPAHIPRVFVRLIAVKHLRLPGKTAMFLALFSKRA